MPGEAAPVEFTRFVSSVEGRVCARWDAVGSVFGAKVATLEERKGGTVPIQWDTDRVIPLTAQFCARYDRELRNALKNGDLKERDAAEYAAWLKVEDEREVEHLKRLEAAAKPAAEHTVETPVAGQPSESSSAPTESNPPDEAASKPEGRKKPK